MGVTVLSAIALLLNQSSIVLMNFLISSSTLMFEMSKGNSLPSILSRKFLLIEKTSRAAVIISMLITISGN